MYFSGIKEKYQNQRRESSCPTQSWRNEYLHQKFTQLLLLHRSQPRGYDFLLRRRNHEVVDEQGNWMEIGDLFGPGLSTQEEPPTVVVHGVAGIGKSTLARQVRGAWEEGRLFKDRFKHVFYFNCRELAQSETMSLAELITKDWAAPDAPIGQILSQPEQLLFILDNLDEPKWDLKEQSSELCPHWSQQQQVHTLLGSLLKKTLLPTASLLITARITALRNLIPSLKHPRWVEVLGFSESARKKYFSQYFTDESQAIRAFISVESNPALLTMCLMPLVSWLVCTCLKQQMEQEQPLPLTSQTTTALCLHYFFHVLQAQSLRTKLRGFCSLAAEGTCQGKTLFSPEDFREHGLDGANISSLLNMGVLQEHPTPRSYSFIHRCFQEFFAAMSYALGDGVLKGDCFNNIIITIDLTDVYDRHDLFGEPTTCFLFGLLSDQGMREMESIFKCSLSRERLPSLLHLAKKEAVSTEEKELYRMSAIQNLHSFDPFADASKGDDLLPAGTEDYIHIRIQQRNGRKTLTTVQWIADDYDKKKLGKAFKKKFACNGTVIEHPEYGEVIQLQGDQRKNICQFLVEIGLAKDDQLKAHGLVRCGLTNNCCKDLASMLGACPSMTELDLRHNDLGDLGVKLLCEGLRQPACQLKHLRLNQTQLSEEMTEMLSLLRQEKPQLVISSRLPTPLRSVEVTEMQDTRKCKKGKHKKRQLITSNRGRGSDLSSFDEGKEARDQKHCYSSVDHGPAVSASAAASPESSLQMQISSLAPDLLNQNLCFDKAFEQNWVRNDSSHQVLQKPYCVSSGESLGHQLLDPLGMDDDFWGPTGPVATEMVDKHRSLYRVHFPVACSYHWPNVGLHFVVRGPVTIEIEFCAWDQFLDQIVPRHSWMVAGPLFDIKAEPGAVAAVHLPHFIALQGQHVDISWFQVAHIKEDGILMEKPASVEPHYIVLENPSFSPIGVLLRMIQTALSIRVIANVLLYYHRQPEEVNFHLYLIPSDCTIRKAIDDEEKKFQFFQIRKSAMQPHLHMGFQYTVSGSDKLEIIPEELELCYRSPAKPQVFSEFYVHHFGSGIRLQIKSKIDETVVWKALVKSGDLRPAAPLVSQALTGQ
ncbi:NACHT, LRR and PYD domains-containing protein 1-like [Myotis myotis]|uniref:NACHT, LRR and PYD domains-containing protein 1-like n=1 Tax=Myotis myotis TaxID=51298 RepID=UPI00174D5AA5|nr:NACHT, LRR and PYD domains-containing protein 1-like [Myotis myotis]